MDKHLNFHSFSSSSSLHTLSPWSFLQSLRFTPLIGKKALSNISCASRLSHISSSPSHFFSCISPTTTLQVRTYAADFASKAIGSRYLAIGDEEGSVNILNTENSLETMIPEARFSAHKNTIFDIQWHPTSPYVATASGDHSAVIWDLIALTPKSILSAHTSSVRCLNFCTSDPNLLVSGARDGHVIVWDLRCTGINCTTSIGNTVGKAYGAANMIRHAHTKKQSSVVSISSVLFHTPKLVISTGAYDGHLRAWDLRHHGSYHRYVYPEPYFQSMDLTQTEKRHYGLRHLLSFQDSFFVLGMNGKLYELHGPQFQPIQCFTSPLYCQPTHYSKFSMDPSGEFLAVGSQLPLCIMYERKTHRTFLLNQGYSAEVTQVCFSKKGGASLMLVTCSDDATVRIWKENDLTTMTSTSSASVSSSSSSSFLSNAYAYKAKEVPSHVESWCVPTPSSATFHKFPSSSTSASSNTSTTLDTTNVTNSTTKSNDVNSTPSTHSSSSKSLTTKNKRTIEEFFRLD